MSFLLVDEIHDFTPRKGARGLLRVPGDVADFPLSLVVEAVGQLAAWVAMENVDFQMRPVAAIAGEVLAHREIRGGDELELTIEVGALRASAIRYGGTARVLGEPAVELRRCTGAMLPMEAFDDPAEVRRHFERLSREGAGPRAFPTRGQFAPTVLDESLGDGRATATLEAPLEAGFYRDHFPRRAVYPATLLLDAKIELARRLLGPDGASAPIRAVRNVKVRAFTPPGGRIDVVVSEADTADASGMRNVRLEAYADGDRVSTATAHFEPASG